MITTSGWSLLISLDIKHKLYQLLILLVMGDHWRNVVIRCFITWYIDIYLLSSFYRHADLFLVTYSCDDDSWNIAYFTFNNIQSIHAFSDNKDGFKMYLMCFLMSVYRISYWYQMYSLSWRSNLLFSCGLLSYYYLLITIFFHH